MFRTAKFALLLAIGGLACRATSSTDPTLSPLGHAWELDYDASRVNPASPTGSGFYVWCPLHGGHIPRNDAELRDATAWLSVHPRTK